MATTIKKSFRFDEETLAALGRIADRHHSTLSAALRYAIKQVADGLPDTPDQSADDGIPTGDELQTRGAKAAVRYLEHQGYEILDLNWECPAGAAPIIAFDDTELVFCQVYATTDMDAGLELSKVDAGTRNRWEKIVAWYLSDHEYTDVRVRLDCLELLVSNPDRALIRHYVNAWSDVD